MEGNHAKRDQRTWSKQNLDSRAFTTRQKSYWLEVGLQDQIEAEWKNMKYKARLVAKGFTQVEGIDFHETFAPITKLVNVRNVIAVAVKKNWTSQ